MNPYEILGVAADATQEEIKRAYRRRAQKTHPDKGGETEDFQKATKAMSLIGDEAKRKHYDEHGAEAEEPDSIRLESLSNLAALFSQVLEDVDPMTVNLIKTIAKMVERRMGELQDLKKSFHKKISKRETAIRRLKKKPKGDPIIVTLIQNSILDLQAQMQPALRQIDVCKHMLELLTGYDYTVDMTGADAVNPMQDSIMQMLNRSRGY